VPFLQRKRRKRRKRRNGKMIGLTATVVEAVMHFGRCVGFAIQPTDRERMLKNTLRSWL